MEQIAVNLMNGPWSVLTIREGKALELKHPEKIVLKGRIETVRQYLDARRTTQQGPEALQFIDKDKAIITINEDDLTIHLDVDLNNPFGTEVYGQLVLNPELTQFNINQKFRFTRDTFIELLTFNRRLFPDRVMYDNVLRSFQKLKVGTSCDIAVDTDNRGNKELLFKKQVDSANIPDSFELHVPLFKGQKPRKFSVDLCLDVNDGGIKIFLVSADLVDLLEEDRKEIIQAELKQYLDYCILWK